MNDYIQLFIKIALLYLIQIKLNVVKSMKSIDLKSFYFK